MCESSLNLSTQIIPFQAFAQFLVSACAHAYQRESTDDMIRGKIGYSKPRCKQMNTNELSDLVNRDMNVSGESRIGALIL
jgi:hypothetical protein